MKRKITKNKIIISILIIISFTLYSLWNLFNNVSKIEQKLINIESITQYSNTICKYYYLIAISFFSCGLCLGLGIGAYKIVSKKEAINDLET